MKTTWTTALALAAFLLPAAGQIAGPEPSRPHPKSRLHAAEPLALHQNALVIDTHADTIQRFIDEGYDLAGPLGGGSLNFESARQGNLGAEFFSIRVDPDLYEGRYARRTLELIDSVYQQAATHPQQMRMAFSSQEILAAHREHKLAALMGIEGGHSIENNLSLLRDYYRLGVRYMTLTWTNSNGWADSSGDIGDPKTPHTKDGLSEFGKDVVYEMNRLGMMVDVSHVSNKTFYRTLIISRAPVIASHSAARALCNAPGNMDDNMLRAIGQYGGVVMINFDSVFLSQAFRDAEQSREPEIEMAIEGTRRKLEAEGKPMTEAAKNQIKRNYLSQIPRPPLSVLIDQIDHIVKIADIDHVGLGSDFDGAMSTPQGLDSAADLPKITQALMARGYSAQDVKKILGENVLHVFQKTEQVSRQLESESRPRIAEKQPGENAK